MRNDYSCGEGGGRDKRRWNKKGDYDEKWLDKILELQLGIEDELLEMEVEK